MISNRAIFALDPGGHSGIAMGIFDCAPERDIADAMKNGIAKDSTTIEGDEYEQIKLISTFWVTFYRDCVFNRCMPPDSVEFICEDFVQRPGGSGGKEGQSPIRIMWGVEGYRMGRADEYKGRKVNAKSKILAPRMILQQPGDAAALGSSKRLKDWGCWIVGKEHERAAWKHIGLRVARVQRLVLAHRAENS